MKKYLALCLSLVVMVSFAACHFGCTHDHEHADTIKKNAEIKAQYGIVAARPCTGKTIFAFLGKPGAGKGTLAEQCARVLDFKKLSTGDLCRAEVASGSERGKAIESSIKAGNLVADDLIVAMVDEWLARVGHDEGNIIFDGFPRSEKQACMILDLLKNKYTDYCYRVVVLDISDQDAINRLADRLVCENKKCQAIYNRTLTSLTCSVCGSTLVRRTDDKEHLVRERLRQYAQYGAELLSLYKAAGFTIETISVAQLTSDQVYNSFRTLLPDEQ